MDRSRTLLPLTAIGTAFFYDRFERGRYRCSLVTHIWAITVALIAIRRLNDNDILQHAMLSLLVFHVLDMFHVYSDSIFAPPTPPYKQ